MPHNNRPWITQHDFAPMSINLSTKQTAFKHFFGELRHPFSLCVATKTILNKSGVNPGLSAIVKIDPSISVFISYPFS
jgi:hypothetical protein